MAKRKTLKQKQKADMRRPQQPTPEHMESSSLPSSSFTPISYTFSSKDNKPYIANTISLSTQSVKKDIVKTTLVSFAIVGLELLLFVMLHQHVLKIPFVAY